MGYKYHGTRNKELQLTGGTGRLDMSLEEVENSKIKLSLEEVRQLNNDVIQSCSFVDIESML